jgi:hypothetical protein
MRGPTMRTLALLATLALAACASVDPYGKAPIAAHLRRADAVGECARLLQRLDQAIDLAGVRDVQSPQVEGFPYLRIDRLTARLRSAADGAEANRAWRERMLALDREARAIELANGGQTVASSKDAAGVDDCRARLADEDRAATQLVEAAQVPDDYSTAHRAFGVYPLTKYAFASGIRNWHEETRDLHALPLAQLPRLGETVRYAPKPPLLLASSDSLPAPVVDALGVPRLTPALTEALLARHAPALEVDTVDANDRLGQLSWGDGGRQIVVDTTRPVAYARVAFTRLAGRVVPQLVYTFWFPSRPAQSYFDALAGNLDGLVWRVTLGPDLKPLVYDTIHPCGCYHLFYPTEWVRARPGPIEGQGPSDEGLFVPQPVDAPRDGERQLLRIAARTHYLRRVANITDETTGAIEYHLRDDNDLRALPWPNESAPRGTKSAYGTDGLIAGSERLERLFFWPMGIASAGQMRQWGHHATAFVGRRHFDDPDLFERYFELSERGADPR